MISIFSITKNLWILISAGLHMIFFLVLIQVTSLPPLCLVCFHIFCIQIYSPTFSSALLHLIYSTYLPLVLGETDFGSSEVEDLNSQCLLWEAEHFLYHDYYDYFYFCPHRLPSASFHSTSQNLAQLGA